MYKRPTNVNVMVWCHVDNNQRDYVTVDNIFVMVPMYKETFVTRYFY